MARDIAEPSQAANPEAELGGIVFVKNHVNEIVTLPNGSAFKFPKSRVVVTDPAIIKGLKTVAKKYAIFYQE